MKLEQILLLVQAGELSTEEAGRLIAQLGAADGGASGISDLGFAQVDLNRERRTGFPEVIYGEGKTAEQIAAIFAQLMKHNDRVLATRVDPQKAEFVLEAIAGAVYHPSAKAVTWLQQPDSEHLIDGSNGHGTVAIVCAGTSDLPVAEEAALTAAFAGCRVTRVYDVGVAGIHRLFRKLPDIRSADAVVVIAGMEGALASVLGGLVAVPVVAVPTSIGYGASFGGIAALLAMLNACSPGIAVVNIDNGFGGGHYAAMIARRTAITAEAAFNSAQP